MFEIWMMIGLFETERAREQDNEVRMWRTLIKGQTDSGTEVSELLEREQGKCPCGEKEYSD